jgi:hypothetical protein
MVIGAAAGCSSPTADEPEVAVDDKADGVGSTIPLGTYKADDGTAEFRSLTLEEDKHFVRAGLSNPNDTYKLTRGATTHKNYIRFYDQNGDSIDSFEWRTTPVTAGLSLWLRDRHTGTIFTMTGMVGGDGPAPDPSFTYCPTQHAGTNVLGHPVVFCDEMFGERPYIHLPDDATGSTATLYVGLANSGPSVLALTLIDRRGKLYVGVDEGGAALSTSGTPSPMPAGLEMPSSRGMYTVYAVRGEVTTFKPSWGNTSVPAFHVTAAAPQVVLAGRTIDARNNGVWEGTVAARQLMNGKATWNADQPLPLRIEFSGTMKKNPNLTAWNNGDVTDADGESYVLSGKIVSLDTSVTDSTGTCLPAFSSLGDRNSFAGASDGTVALYRLGAMHFGGDEELVLNYPIGVGFGANGMGDPAVTTPINFIQLKDNADYASVDIHPHGLGFGNVISIHPVLGSDAGGTTGCH